MNLKPYVNPVLNKMKSFTTESIAAFTTSSPIANLRSSILQMRAKFTGRQDAYDSLAGCLSSTDEVYEHCANEAADSVKDSQFSMIPISEETAQSITSGVATASVLMAEDAPTKIEDAKGRDVTFSDAEGNVYQLSFDNEVTIDTNADYQSQKIRMKVADRYVDFLTKDRSGYKLASHFIPVNSSALFDSALGYRNTIQGFLYDLGRAENFIPSSDSGQTIKYLSFWIGLLLLTDQTDQTIRGRFTAIAVKLGWSGDESTATLVELMQYIAGEVKLRLRRVKTKFLDVASSLVCSSAINEFLGKCCDALLSSKFAQAIMTLYNSVLDKSKAIINIAKRFVAAFSQGGFKGAFSFLLSFIKHGKSIIDEDGKLVATDNNALVPREYIAGIVTTVLGAVAAVAQALAWAFSKVFAVIFSLVGSLVTAVVNSVGYDYSNTRAGIERVKDDENPLLLKAWPVALVQHKNISMDSHLSIVELYDEAKEQYPSGYLDIPFGQIIFGPSELDEDGATTSILVELHPSSFVFDFMSTTVIKKMKTILKRYGFWAGADTDNYGFKASAFNNVLQSDEAMNNLRSMYCELTAPDMQRSVVNEGEVGAMSNADDFCAWYSLIFWTEFLYLVYRVGDDRARPFPAHWSSTDVVFGGYSGGNSTYGSLLDGQETYIADYCMAQISTWMYHESPSEMTLMATDYTKFLERVSRSGSEYFFTSRCWVMGTGYWIGFDLDPIPQNDEYNPWLNAEFEHLYVRIPEVFSDDTRYELCFPKYNQNTFFAWIILANAIVAASVAVTVTIAVKFNKWRKQKRARNVARFNAAQSDYQDAVNGVQRSINPETGQEVITEFDPNSAEGKAIVKSAYKGYKTTAFKNNLWSHIVGGTKYDISTFWGEAEETDDESLGFSGLIPSVEDYQEIMGVDTSVSSSEIDALTNNRAITELSDESIPQLIDILLKVYKKITGSDLVIQSTPV